MADDVTGYRRVLHTWAVRQLEEKSPHVGPFEVTAVRMSHENAKEWSAVTYEDALTDVAIRFRHDGGACPDAYKKYYGAAGPFLRDRCEDTQWSPMESNNTVAMINELLAIADE